MNFCSFLPFGPYFTFTVLFIHFLSVKKNHFFCDLHKYSQSLSVTYYHSPPYLLPCVVGHVISLLVTQPVHGVATHGCFLCIRCTLAVNQLPSQPVTPSDTRLFSQSVSQSISQLAALSDGH